MKFNQLHKWQLSIQEARQLQIDLAVNIISNQSIGNPRFIAGVDVSTHSAEIGFAAVVILSYPELDIIELRTREGKYNFPYIPGLLSFREAPIILSAFEDIKIRPDLILVDGQGIAHPRRLGIASHLGLILDIPTIGCAKSRLCGSHDIVLKKTGSYSFIKDNNEIIGVALRTKQDVKPVFISIGHKINMEASINWTMKCCDGYRLPEPGRLAHLAATANLTKSIRFK